MKSIKRVFTFAVSLLSIGSIATAGTLAQGEADPVVEDLMVEEQSSSIGWLPILAVIAVGALVLSSDDDKKCKEFCEE